MKYLNLVEIKTKFYWNGPLKFKEIQAPLKLDTVIKLVRQDANCKNGILITFCSGANGVQCSTSYKRSEILSFSIPSRIIGFIRCFKLRFCPEMSLQATANRKSGRKGENERIRETNITTTGIYLNLL